MEQELIDWLLRRLPPHRRLTLPPGDDAALVSCAHDRGCVVTVDMLMDGVDFDLAAIDARRAGRKALAVNLSDLAAMAAQPVAAVIALALPSAGGLALAQQLYEGLLPLAEEFDVAIAGGDVNSWDAPLVISVTLLGEPTPRGIWRRSGARPGDWLLVTGELGGSILGRHLDFTPRVREALALVERYEIHAAIDLSDGLALDLTRLASASGVGAELDLAAIPVAAAAHELAERQGNSRTPLEHALGDGEDFELLLAAPADVAQRLLAEQPLDVPIACLGRVTAETGCWQVDRDGRREPLKPLGWQHRLT